VEIKFSIFVVSAILLVPFLYFAASPLPDACAVPPSTGYLFSKNCSGDEQDQDKGQLCCWNEKDKQGKDQLICQVCREAEGGLDCDQPVVMAPPPLKPGLSGTLEEGNVLEGNATGRLPGGGIFKAPETNLTFSQTDSSSNMSNNSLAELQSDIEETEENKPNGIDAEEEQDEGQESEDSNEEEN
jgi:hypothetical protein